MVNRSDTQAFYNTFLVAFLDLHGVHYEPLNVGERVFFAVHLDEEVNRLAKAYFQNELVPAKQFSESIRKVRRDMYEAKRGSQNEDRGSEE